MAPAGWLGSLSSDRNGVSSSIHGDAGYALTSMTDTTSDSGGDDLRTLIHRLNNQLGVILAHAALQAMSLARVIRVSMADSK